MRMSLLFSLSRHTFLCRSCVQCDKLIKLISLFLYAGCHVIVGFCKNKARYSFLLCLKNVVKLWESQVVFHVSCFPRLTLW